MKAKLFGAALLAVALAGCGGKASFTISGTVYGLTSDGLVLENNGADPLKVPAGATSFSFPNSISYGTMYNVTVKSSPAYMLCDVAGTSGQGSAGHTTSINVVVNCNQKTFALGGTISNLTGDGLTIINGSFGTPLSIAKGTPTFTFANIPVGQTYGLTIKDQPAGQVCTLSNGTGVMSDYERRDVKIDCVTKI
ncbi:hypothetical protein ABT364_22165 [Massilia sp. SR12]